MTPVLVGSAAAFYDGQFSPVLFLVALFASVAIHAGTNLANDYYDHVRGVDAHQAIGPSGVIQQGLLRPATVLKGALLLFAVSGLLGLTLVAVRGWPVLVIGVLSVLAGYSYTGGPLPLGYLGLGDVIVSVFMGFVILCGTYYVHAGSISATALWAALPVAALVDAILVVNNLRDLEGDRARGKRTLATFIGPGATRAHYLALLVITYTSVAIAVGIGVLPALSLLVILTIPFAIRTWQVVRSETDAVMLTRNGLAQTARLHARVGELLAIALVLSRL